MPVPVVPEGSSARTLGEKLAEAGEQIVQIRSLASDKITENHENEVRDLKRFIQDFDAVHQAKVAGERAAYVPESNGPTAAFDEAVEAQRSIGDMVTRHADYNEFARSGRVGTQSTILNFERALIAEGDAANSSLFEPVAQPKRIDPLERRIFVRSLLSQANTTYSSVPYMQETNIAANELGANVTAQGAAKNEVALAWTPKDAPIRKITAWIPLTTEIIEDAPLLRGYIDNRILYMIRLREELEFLSGDGTGAHILGIRNTTGTQTQDAVAGDVPATFALAVGKVENVDGNATGVAMNPLDFWEAIATRHSSTFDNGYGGSAPSTVGSISWGLPVVRSRSLERTAAIVADWRQGATVLDRSEATIEVGNQHSDFFVTNKVAVRAEERVGLAVDRPFLFVETTLDLTA